MKLRGVAAASRYDRLNLAQDLLSHLKKLFDA
jgi:hypothetical protein